MYIISPVLFLFIWHGRQAMQKISANYLNKKMPPIHELNHDEINQQWYIVILFCFVFLIK